MLIRDQNPNRELREVRFDADLVVVGGGLAGTCAAITAAREGARVVLVQDRPVLGGNASSEVRLWVLGATSHMGNNNRWAREGGLINEILLDSVWRNPEGNPVLFDSLLLEKAISEPNLTLLLNTAAHDVSLDADGGVERVRAFCSQNSVTYDLRAPVFCDASGDGVVGFLAGAAFRIGAESRDEFGEMFAPEQETQDLLGHSLYFYARDTGRPVRYTPPAFALDDITKIPRYRRFSTQDQGCSLWWIEYGGRRDTVHETEEIKWELWKVVYGVWDHIKNSGEFPDAETMTLEWVGGIPGKRESRRFEGDHMLVQQDIVEQREHHDAVSFGGWAIDLHPSEGVYSAEEPCTQWHSRGVYQIPYRCMYSRNVPNLFLAGRIISASHVAFGSSRVMATCAHGGQAVGAAAALCVRDGLRPADLAGADRIGELQQSLLKRGQYIPGVALTDRDDLVASAAITASSELKLAELPTGDTTQDLTDAHALLIPVPMGDAPEVTVFAASDAPTTLRAELRTSSRLGGFTPDLVLDAVEVGVGGEPLGGPHRLTTEDTATNGKPNGSTEASGSGIGLLDKTALRSRMRTRKRSSALQAVKLPFRHRFDQETHAFVCLMPNERVEIALSDRVVTGVTTVTARHNPKVAKTRVQSPPEGVGVESFEFWTPERWSKGRNVAAGVSPAIEGFSPENLRNGVERPVSGSNAWVADPEDRRPTLKVSWENPVEVSRVELAFDCDYDDSLEQVLVHHKERAAVTCVRSYKILDESGHVLHSEEDNHQGRRSVVFDAPVTTAALTIELEHPNDRAPASVFAVRCYGPGAPDRILAHD